MSDNETKVGGRDPFLTAMGMRARQLRSRKGMTRKAAALAARVSERHLANLEHGVGNVSTLVLVQLSQALECSIAEIIGDITTTSPEWLMIRELLSGKDEASLRNARGAIQEVLGSKSSAAGRKQRIALIGLRGAGKSTLGKMLSKFLGFQFLELSAEIEKFAGCSISEIQALYGQTAYRRYERRALEESIQIYAEAVIATPGGLVSDPANFNDVLTHCTTIWLQAAPEDHMNRVIAQGDMRPMASSKEAMEDLKAILSGREEFYSKADYKINTSAQSLDATFEILKSTVQGVLSH
jgi:XRE family aerobic/anaerobic benzoate catabolism transcriptional regulator